MKNKLFEHIGGNQFKILSNRNLLKEETFNTVLYKVDDEDPRFAPEQSEIPIEVEYYVTKASRGARGSFGEPLEPDEEGDVEIEKIYNGLTGQPIQVTNEELNDIEQKIWEDLANY